MSEAELENASTLAERLEALNTELLDNASQSAAQAFNVGCLISLLGIAVIVTLATIFSHWVSGVVALIISTMLAISIANLMASRSYQGNLRLTYERQIAPKIPEIQATYGLDREALLAALHEHLPQDAPLVALIQERKSND